MGCIQLKSEVYFVGVLNPFMRIFDVIMRTEYGTSYNAHLITGEKNVLIDTVHENYFDEYIENIRSVIDLEKIDFVVMNHCEPDHSGSLSKLLKLVPQIQVLASTAGKIYLRHITNDPNLNVQAVKDGEVLQLGAETSLQFFNAPFLHWPDSMFTWFPQEKILFTCDFFGAHFCEPRLLDSHTIHLELYEQEFKKYFDAIFSPFIPYVQKGLETIKQIDPDIVCTSHGIILTKGIYLQKAILQYEQWSSKIPQPRIKIPLFLCTAYGNTRILAESIAKGIQSVLKEADISVYDINQSDIYELRENMNNSDAFLIGSPTINKDAVLPVWEMICAVDAIHSKGKPVGVFGSFGWSGEAVPAIIGRMLKAAVFEEGYTCRFVPSQEELHEAFEYGVRFASMISTKS